MSSNFERKSLEDLKEQSRRQVQIAAELEPYLTVTEKSWRALIGLQQIQIQLLAEVQAAAMQLATKENLEEYLDQRVQELENCSLEIQSSRQESLPEEQMKKFSTVLFWIALIPSAALVILELISHIFPLILQG